MPPGNDVSCWLCFASCVLGLHPGPLCCESGFDRVLGLSDEWGSNPRGRNPAALSRTSMQSTPR